MNLNFTGSQCFASALEDAHNTGMISQTEGEVTTWFLHAPFPQETRKEYEF